MIKSSGDHGKQWCNGEDLGRQELRLHAGVQTPTGIHPPWMSIHSRPMLFTTKVPGHDRGRGGAYGVKRGGRVSLHTLSSQVIWTQNRLLLQRPQKLPETAQIPCHVLNLACRSVNELVTPPTANGNFYQSSDSFGWKTPNILICLEGPKTVR